MSTSANLEWQKMVFLEAVLKYILFAKSSKSMFFLFHVPFQSWMIYECSSNVNREGIFIQQNRNADHFEVITELVSLGPESSSLAQVASIDRPFSQLGENHHWTEALQNCEATETEPASKKVNSELRLGRAPKDSRNKSLEHFSIYQ